MLQKILILGLLIPSLSFATFLGNPQKVVHGGTGDNVLPSSGQIAVGNGSSIYAPVTVGGDLSFTSSGIATVNAIQGTSVSAPTGTGAVVLATSPTLSNPVVGTQASSDNSTKAASTAYVQTALAQLNPAAAVYAASTANIAGTYTNAVSGVCIGDTFTTTATTAFALDGTSPAIGARVLFKNQTSTFQNGVWTLTTQAVGGVSGAILTRALDSDSATDLNSGQIVPVANGTVNAGSSWYQTAVVATCNTSAQTWTQFQASSSSYLQAANNLSDLSNAGTARTNLGLGTLATTSTSGTSIVYGNGTGGLLNVTIGSNLTFSGGTLSATGGSGSVSWQSAQTSAFTAAAGNAYPVNTTSGAITVTLPASPSAGNLVTLTDYANTWASNNVTINPNGNNLMGLTTNATLAVNRESINLVYADSTQGWIPYAGWLGAAPSRTYSASYVVVGGGGGGAGGSGAGGGAGGLLSGTATLTSGTTYTVTIGPGGTSGGTTGSNGTASVLSGSGITTVTALPGGSGGYSTGNGNATSSGTTGSGGGGGPAGSAVAGFGTSPQGYNGGSGLTAGTAGGGGGGCGGVGGASSGSSGNTNDTGGAGGLGCTTSITGSVVTLASGGGGGAAAGGGTCTPGSASAGGGASGTCSGNASNATANTGGGGGGGAGNGSSGGSGVVYISVPTSAYSGTTTGSPTVTTSGGNTIMKFTASGSYTG
jgi:glycine rich protein